MGEHVLPRRILSNPLILLCGCSTSSVSAESLSFYETEKLSCVHVVRRRAEKTVTKRSISASIENSPISIPDGWSLPADPNGTNADRRDGKIATGKDGMTKNRLNVASDRRGVAARRVASRRVRPRSTRATTRISLAPPVCSRFSL